MKILITSDNHLGYKETDAIRQDDSFNTFDEILQLGVLNKVELILQVGDLFHENRPSRYCINKTINILRKHIVDEMNNQKYEINNIPMLSSYKVKIPFLCIHGNHDDPSGFNKISTLDILHSAGLVNYIGKDSEICDFVQYDNIRIYGIGYLKDKNVTDIFKKIQYKDLSTDFFNILLVHQNRVPRNKDFLCPSAIPKSFNLLIYGHEHDPMIIRNDTMLLQCGSTVRTSLSDAECNEKYCYIFEEHKNVLNKIRLNSVRPFIIEDTNLIEEKDLIQKIDELLVNYKFNIKCLDKSKRQKFHKIEKSKLINVVNINNPLEYPPLLPLVRLRILTTSVLNINKNRLSHTFKDKVSNPSEIIKLIPHKKSKSKPSDVFYQSQNITDIIINHFKSTPLDCIPEYKFIEYFNKDNSFVEMVENNMQDISRSIKFENCIIDNLNQEIRQFKIKSCRSHETKINRAEISLFIKNDEIIDCIKEKSKIHKDEDIECLREFNEKENFIDNISCSGELNDFIETENSENINCFQTLKNPEDNLKSKNLKFSIENLKKCNEIRNNNLETNEHPNFLKVNLKENIVKNQEIKIFLKEKMLVNSITAKDSKTVRKSLNNKPLFNQFEKNEIVNDFKKANSPFFTSEFSEIEDKSLVQNNNVLRTKNIHDNESSTYLDEDKLPKNSDVRKIFTDESDSTDLIIDF